MIPDDRKYTKEHEWVKVEGGSQGLVGITHYAQEQLGDVVFVQLPAVGEKLQQFKKLGEIESVKAVSDLYSPVSGEVIEVNSQLQDKPELVNQDPYGQGWMLRVRLSDPKELGNLLSAQEYDAYLQSGGH